MTSNITYRAQKYSLRFAHAAMRLRDRYGITLTEKMYERANQQFFQHQAHGLITNRRGDLEGWIIIKPENPDEGEAQLVPAVFCVSDGLIATFFAKAPELSEAELAEAQLKLGYGVAPRLQTVSSLPAKLATTIPTDQPRPNRKARLAAARADEVAMAKAIEDAAHFEVRAWLRKLEDEGVLVPHAMGVLRKLLHDDEEIREMVEHG